MNRTRTALLIAPILLLALAGVWLLLAAPTPTAAPGLALASPSAAGGAGSRSAAPLPRSTSAAEDDPTRAPASPLRHPAPGPGPGRARLWGRVSTAGGAPLAEATVALKRLAPAVEAEYDDWGGPPPLEELDELLPPLARLELATVLECTTDADGRFCLDLPPQAAGYPARWLSVTHPGHVPVAADLYAPLASEVELEVELPLAASLELSLRPPAGEPLDEPALEVHLDFAPLLPIPSRGLVFRPQALSKTGSPQVSQSLDAATGTFRGLPPGELEAAGVGAGYAVASRALSLRPGEAAALTLELGRGRRLRGRARTRSGAPVEGVSVTFSLKEPEESERSERPARALRFLARLREATSDAEGAFELSGLEDLAYSVSAEAEGYEPWSATLGAGERELQVVLTRHFQLQGRLSGAEPGHALVSLTPLGGGALEPRAARVEVGHGFRLEEIPAGRYLLSAAAPGRVTLAPLELEVDRDLKDLELSLQAGLEATLLVRDPGGAPLAGASLDDFGLPTSPGFGASQATPQGESDASGRLQVEGLVPGEHRFRVVKPGYRSALVLLVVTPGRTPAAQEVLLEQGARLEAQLSHEQDELLPGAWIHLRHLSEPQHSRELRLREYGLLLVDELAPGTYRIEAELAVGPTSFGTLTLRAGELRKAQLRAQPWGRGRIAGRVLRGHNPAHGARVWVQGGPAPELPRLEFTDAEGAFSCEGLAAGSYRVLAQGGQGVGVELAAGESAQLQLKVWEASVAGTLLLSSGEPAPAGLALGLVTPDEVLSATTDARGSFRFAAVPPGSLRLAARTRYGSALSAPLSLGPREQLAGLRLRLEASAGLELKVLRADGSPAAGVQVSLFSRELGAYAAAEGGLQATDLLPHTTDPQGILRLQNLLPGRYVLRASSATRAQAARAEVQLRVGGEPARETLTLAPPAALKVLAPPGARVWVAFAGARLETAWAGPAGEARFPALPAVEVEVGVEVGVEAGVQAGVEGRPGPRTLALASGSELTLDLRSR